MTDSFFPGQKKVLNLGIYHIIVHGVTIKTISERLKTVRKNVWNFCALQLYNNIHERECVPQTFWFHYQKVHTLSFHWEKNEVSEAILKNFGTFCISIPYVDSAQRCSLSVRPKCPISNFRSKNRPNWSERLLGPLKFVPDWSRVIGHPPATSGRILKLSQIEVIFNSPLRIRTHLNCPLFSLAFFVLCLRIRVLGGTKCTTR